MRAADRNKLWERKFRPLLKKRFESLGVTRCEKCSGTFALGFAHRLKRRFINCEVELQICALLCSKCHETIEHSGHDAMFKEVTLLIANRQTKELDF